MKDNSSRHTQPRAARIRLTLRVTASPPATPPLSPLLDPSTPIHTHPAPPPHLPRRRRCRPPAAHLAHRRTRPATRLHIRQPYLPGRPFLAPRLPAPSARPVSDVPAAHHPARTAQQPLHPHLRSHSTSPVAHHRLGASVTALTLGSIPRGTTDKDAGWAAFSAAASDWQDSERWRLPEPLLSLESLGEEGKGRQLARWLSDMQADYPVPWFDDLDSPNDSHRLPADFPPAARRSPRTLP